MFGSVQCHQDILGNYRIIYLNFCAELCVHCVAGCSFQFLNDPNDPAYVSASYGHSYIALLGLFSSCVCLFRKLLHEKN